METNNMKRKILKDRNFPGTEQIAKHQNFNSVNKSATVMKKILIKKILLWGGGSVITASAIVTAVYLNKTDNTVKPAPKHDFVRSFNEPLKHCVQPPLAGMQKEFASYKISRKNGGSIHYASGSIIKIPANAFINKNGNPVSDSVEIKYREFHNPLDIFLSGIPMNYDSAEKKYTFESAGMLEILAFDREENLMLNENTSIEISMASSDKDSRFNLYELDTVNKNWVCKGKDKITFPEKINSTENKSDFTYDFVTEKIIKPEISDDKKFSFKISFDKNLFPELSAYDNVLFEVADNNFNQKFYKINWDKISLNATNAKGIYSVKLKKADTTVAVSAKPVFEKEDYAKAMETFDAKVKQANKQSEEKEAEKNSRLNKVNKNLSTYNRDKMVSAAKGMSAVMNSIQVDAFRNFRIQRLGIFNCDVPMPPLPVEAVVRYANAVRKDGSKPKKLDYSQIFMVQKGINTVFRFSINEPIRFKLSAPKIIWTLTDKREFAFFHTEDFDKLSRGEQNAMEPMIEDEATAMNKIKKFLE